MINSVILFEDGRTITHSSPTKYIGKTFEKGYYKAKTDSNGNIVINDFQLKEIHTPFNSDENVLMINTVNNFFEQGVKEKINSLGFLHKLGILMYGRQGTAKTSLMHYIAEMLVKQKDAIVFFCDSDNELFTTMALANSIREIQSNPLIFIMDEFDKYVRETESNLKNFLDGKDSVDNSLFLANTNYIDKIPDTLKNRPSRFKICQELKGITDKNYMTAVITTISEKIQPGLFTEQEIKDIVKIKDNVTMDELKHICLDKATNVYIPKTYKATIGFNKTEEEKVEEKTYYSFAPLDFKLTNPKPVKTDSTL